ncbi:hypothetical protein [Mesorhizobium sp.]|uniref:hypothetical protein n=1 Tax=Mesorhizobium sp. TaxID=1871066 RepID=UPI000FE66087|nr:hypothetical protein [Mesorhizobium sp.]RWM29465.1 MAG: hypothetical protein EOR74_07240 [Mesorhizobium sp.]RWM42386.1 MAG: hypothetical protein EOR75_00495 [Mesorhizobium sp.]TJV52845.1 MAG: sulfotransferase [Mesorhizobium sp.]
MGNPTFFAIVFVGRQGSSYLQGLIDSHPDATCEGELFSPTARFLADLLRRRTISFRNSRQRDVASYLEKRLHKKDSSVIGFKMPYMSLVEHPDAKKAFEAFGYRVIRLSRDNLLDQYISFKLATINSAWRSDRGSIKITHFKAEPADVEETFQKWTKWDSELSQMVANLPNLHVTYEELVDGSGVSRSLEFLNLRKVSLHSPFKRQRSGSQSDIIENYAELKGHFAQTEWARHFVA